LIAFRRNLWSYCFSCNGIRSKTRLPHVEVVGECCDMSLTSRPHWAECIEGVKRVSSIRTFLPASVTAVDCLYGAVEACCILIPVPSSLASEGNTAGFRLHRVHRYCELPSGSSKSHQTAPVESVNVSLGISGLVSDIDIVCSLLHASATDRDVRCCTGLVGARAGKIESWSAAQSICPGRCV
jgi:hypothetical protein